MAKTDGKLDLLARVQLFEHCSQRELRTISAPADLITADEGEVLAKEGKPGLEFFVIAEGKAKVSLRGKKLAALKSGDFFGEMSLLDHSPRSATVTAESPMRLWVISPAAFQSMLTEAPTVGLKIMRGLAQRLRALQKSPVY